MEADNKTHDNELDPRIQVELENLNKYTDEINKLEIELDVSKICYLFLAVSNVIYVLN